MATCHNTQRKSAVDISISKFHFRLWQMMRTKAYARCRVHLGIMVLLLALSLSSCKILAAEAPVGQILISVAEDNALLLSGEKNAIRLKHVKYKAGITPAIVTKFMTYNCTVLQDKLHFRDTRPDSDSPINGCNDCPMNRPEGMRITSLTDGVGNHAG